MIQSVLIFNQLGKPRLVKFYEPLDASIQQTLVREIHTLVSKRPDTLCNFLESSQSVNGARIIYRHYATLFFVFLVDSSESELGILDLIQVFVEALDRVFENVCELDLIFHFDEIHYVLAEVVSAGMVVETNLKEISRAVTEAKRMAKPVQEGSRLGIGALRRGFA
ncbi:adaptor-related protein complex 3 sigma 1 subunit, isoform CRA_a [Kickxella alabastrina]|uniref:adaptor-related protein complex 3 sigma 1 subunit, isoform CRA_a n=1 Tax=Kickxella alabastrina TaxID=61397 RepID=UPI00221F8262|nr:adaptor-related protein complex 3 sigma 1 subunit, isoform CRA_a [Kickxella alabastrina]KAI7820613.1 adaptor-related protein complex 3 sigma 1 subunit, isoform CRA_a [Kickxella alabastrina]